MALVNQPPILPSAFASEGDKNVIPSNNDGLAGLASISKGFPPITQLPLAQGGLPPQRQDFNGIFNLFSKFLIFAQNGGVFQYNNGLDYQPPAIVAEPSSKKIYKCLKANGAGTSAGVQPLTNTTYWEELVPEIDTSNFAKLNTTNTFTKDNTFDNSTADVTNIYVKNKGTRKGQLFYTSSQSIFGMTNVTSNSGLWLYDDGKVLLKATNLQTTAKDVVSAINEVNSQSIGIGDVVFLPYSKRGFVKYNGATVNRSDYPNLVEYAKTNNLWTNVPNSEPWKFGIGDGSTTMVLPDYRNRVVMSGDVAGIKEAGLPNITGKFITKGIEYASTSSSGALYDTNGGNSTYSSHAEGARENATINLDASRSSAIYGKSNTVQPPAIVLIPQARY